MKTSFRPAPRARFRISRPLFLTALVALLFALDFFSDGKVRAPFRALSALSAGAKEDASVFFSGAFSTRTALSAENAELRDEIERFRLQSAALDILREENTRLKELAHLTEDESGVSARILSGGVSSYGTFLVGAGTAQGVSTGDIALTADGFAIGRVSDAHEDTSLVSELFAPGASLAVTLKESALVVEGRGGGNGRIKAPRALSVARGDVAVSPELRGAPVGVVGEIESDPASAYQTIYVRTPVNISATRFLYIRKP